MYLRKIITRFVLLTLWVVTGTRPVHAEPPLHDVQTLEDERARLLLRFTEKHPAILDLNRRIGEARNQRRTSPPPPSQPLPLGKVNASKPWTPTLLSRSDAVYLPDFSYAGYHWGERAFPQISGTRINVTEFGAVPNDKLDDTAAIQAAFHEAHKLDGPVTVHFPAGRFILRRALLLTRTNLSVIGAGSSAGGTEIHIPIPLSKMSLPGGLRQQAPKGLSNPFSYWGGIFWATQPRTQDSHGKTWAVFGTREKSSIKLVPATAYPAGTILELAWCATECSSNSFFDHLLNGAAITPGDFVKKAPFLAVQKATVVGRTHDSITIKEPLIHDIKRAWSVAVKPREFLQELVLEGLRISFPRLPYAGHFIEPGYNAIFLDGIANAWIRDIRIVDADLGIWLQNCYNVTISDITTGGRKGHHSVSIKTSNNILVENFRLNAPTLHNPTFGYFAVRNVFSNGDIREARLDQHAGLNQQNLIDNVRIEMKDVGQLFDHGGGWGPPTAGAFSTFWNIDVTFRRQSKLEVTDAPSARIIGLHGNKPIRLRYGPNAYIDGLNKHRITIPSLYANQKAKRLARNKSALKAVR